MKTLILDGPLKDKFDSSEGIELKRYKVIDGYLHQLVSVNEEIGFKFIRKSRPQDKSMQQFSRKLQ